MDSRFRMLVRKLFCALRRREIWLIHQNCDVSLCDHKFGEQIFSTQARHHASDFIRREKTMSRGGAAAS